MFQTPICKQLNIQVPIIQGGMAWVATAKLAAAVSNAGGLGIVAAGNAPAEVVEAEIIKARKLTDKPFGVNVMLLSPFIDEVVDVVCRQQVPVVTTGAGNPGKYMDRLKAYGAQVIPVVPSVAMAKRMERSGADALIVEGTEAGGHIGELTTMALVPQVVKAVKIPVIAAGGMADGKGLLAALSLGAQAVQMGTRFVCSIECEAHDAYKQTLVKAGDRDAIVTARSSGHPVRVIKNKLTRELLRLEKEGASQEEMEKLGVGRLRMAVQDGDMENGSVMSGQIAGLIQDVLPCETIIQQVMEEARQQLEILNSLKGDLS
ncbi:MAG: enoyl-[acyl-carrier-protein] reductase FabK [Bacillota bacterium]|nr:enoyl-[acyl-carrier-protein] reductase FabK [Bacillota bacterium]MDW7676249.1 enoyl-[acyl-carrier-protein] reductase FabK [Bacillota bacterium]